MKNNEPNHTTTPAHGEAAAECQAGGGDRIAAAQQFLREFCHGTGKTLGPPGLTREETGILAWAESVGLLLNPDDLLPKLLRGGMEHDVFLNGNRVVKVTKNGIFGFSPGLELMLIDARHSADAQRFHLWEATPMQYLERLELHNLLLPGFNDLLGVVSINTAEVAIVTAQPKLRNEMAVSQSEIDAWFGSQGFARVTAAGFYREADNLAVFDAHDKNVLRDGPDFVPFDVIPCRPASGFLSFIEHILADGGEPSVLRTTTSQH
jgi:hypothetical protein